MVHCIAFGCSNSDKEAKLGKSFFRVPKKGVSKKQDSLRKAWFAKLRLQNPPDESENVRVCQDHFVEDDFLCDMQSALGFKKPKRQLKPDAVPSVFIFTKKHAERKLSTKRSDQRARKEVCLFRIIATLPPMTGMTIN